MATFIPRPREVPRREKEITTLPSTRPPFATRSKATHIPSSNEAARHAIASDEVSVSTKRSIEPSFRTRKHDVTSHASSRVPIIARSQLVSPGDSVSQNNLATVPNVLRRKRSLIGDHVKKNREKNTRDGPGNLSIRIPQQKAALESVPAQQQNWQGLRTSAVAPDWSTMSDESTEQPRDNYHAPTPLSVLSATPSLRDDSPSIFSQISPSSATTPATSVTGYSPQVIQSPHFGPGYSTRSPMAKSQPAHEQSSSHFGQKPLTLLSLRGTRSRQLSSPAISRDSSAAATVTAQERLSEVNILRQAKGNVGPVRLTATTYRGEGTNVVRPPELAHLETANTGSVAIMPPERPNRVGGDELTALPTYASPTMSKSRELGLHALRGYSGPVEARTRVKPVPTQARTAITNDLKLSQSQPTSSVARTRLSIKPPERPRLINTTVPPASANPHSLSASTPASAASGKSSSRFGFFHRKDKIPAATSDVDDSMQARKGPTAGTGHEGYGRHANKRRSSGGTSSKRGSSGSTSSLGGDDFLARKAVPVYLRKGNDGQLLQSDRNSSGFEDGRTSQMSSDSSYETYRSTMQRADIAHRTQVPLPLHDHQPILSSIKSRGSNARAVGEFETNHAARPRNRSKDSRRGPTPENDVKNYLVSRLPTPFAGSRPGPVPSLAVAGKAGASVLRNLFGIANSRAKSSSKPSQIPAPILLTDTEVTMDGSSVIPSSVQSGKVMAHYEILGSLDSISQAHDHVEMEEIGGILEEAVLTDVETRPEAEDIIRHAPLVAACEAKARTRPVEFADCGLTLAPELQRQHSKRSHPEPLRPIISPQLPGHADLVKLNDRRRSRLPQVADNVRINPNQKSFSRPFDASNLQPNDASSGPLQPLPLGHTEPGLPKRNHPSLDGNTVTERDPPQAQAYRSIQDAHTRNPDEVASQAPAFLAMPARKDSDVSVSSSSGSLSFWRPIQPDTAALPRPGSQISPDEVWQEYDDLIDKVLTPSDSQPSSNASKTTKGTDYFSERPRQPRHRSKTDDLKSKSSTPFPQLGEMATSIGTRLSPFAGIAKRSPEFTGQQHPALGANQPPIRPLPDPPRPAVQISSASQLIRRASVKTSKQTGEPSIDKLDTLNLAKAALEVSKWMSFDQILVSPAHDELQTAHDEKVLVVDGLGKEWSLFCAQNYPHTQVFGLSPAPYETGPNQLSSPLPNYRHVRSSNLAVSFPFPQNTFHTVVFRFPAATSEFSLGRAISECKRVLIPGGFLEVCVVDLDLDIMGPKTRRAVKGLKERLQQSQPDVSLKPTSDYVQYLLGRYGLDNLHRVMIGVPVAGVISSSPDRSKDEGVALKPQHAPKSSQARRNDMFRTLAPKVARWWYTQTYEQKILATNASSRSIWNDPGLLKECKDKQAAFRLLICHAQKPVLNKRKTQSL